MNGFERQGEMMLLAEQGRQQLARELAAVLGRWWSRLKTWQERMPGSLPPTEAILKHRR